MYKERQERTDSNANSSCPETVDEQVNLVWWSSVDSPPLREGANLAFIKQILIPFVTAYMCVCLLDSSLNQLQHLTYLLID
jgi:hypothetical protein